MDAEGEVCFSGFRRNVNMDWLIYANWLLGPVLQITLATVMIRRGLRATFPRFFSYLIFQTVKSGFLFVVYRYYEASYFDAYWAGNAISIMLVVTVMDEILQHLFKRYGGIQSLALVIFRWTCGLLLVLAILSAISSQEGGADRVVATVLAFDRSMRVIQCGLFFLLMLLCRALKNCWRQHVFGIALGFGLFASIELILVSIVTHYGNGPAAIVSLAKGIAYNGVTLLWIGYLKQPDEAPSEILVPGLGALNVALATSVSGAQGDDSFLAMVEDAVDRVLSRSSWPRPSANGTHIVGRQPQREERN